VPAFSALIYDIAILILIYLIALMYRPEISQSWGERGARPEVEVLCDFSNIGFEEPSSWFS
jgi:hypothetical protein